MSRRVLVVEGDHDVLEVCLVSLERVGGFAVDTASTAAAALELLAQGALPDAVLLDVMLPGLDGLSLVRRLRQSDRTRDLPVVLLTLQDLPRGTDLVGLGVRGALGKPFDPMTLPAQVSQLLRWSGG